MSRPDELTFFDDEETDIPQDFLVSANDPGFDQTSFWALSGMMDQQRMGQPGETWEQFAARNPELLTWKPSILDRYYTPDTLASDAARRAFVLPDRVA